MAQVVDHIVKNSGKYNVPEKFLVKHLDELQKNDSFLWSTVTNNTLSTISELSSPLPSPLKTPLSPDIYSSVFFEFPTEKEKPNDSLACIDFILWERLSYQHVYPNVTLLRQSSTSSSKSGSLKRLLRKFTRRSRSSESDIKGEVAVLSLPGLTSSNKAVNDLGKEVKSVPLNSSLLLLSQTRKLLPDGAWYFNYLDGVSVVYWFCMRFAWESLYMCTNWLNLWKSPSQICPIQACYRLRISQKLDFRVLSNSRTRTRYNA